MPPPPTPSNVQPIPTPHPIQYNPYYMQQPGSTASPRATLPTMPYPQTTVRYGNPPNAANTRPGTPTLQYPPGPPTPYTPRYMPMTAGAPGPPPTVRPPPVTPHRTASNSSFGPYTAGTPTSTKPPLPTPLQATTTYFGGASPYAHPPGSSAPPTGVPLPTSSAAPAPPTGTAAAAAANAPTGAVAAAQKAGRKPMSLRGAFSKELHALMYACGDDANPAFDSVNVMEEILIEYIEQLCTSALRGQTKPRLTADGLRRALSRTGDSEKLGRLNDLVYRENVIATARRSWKDPY